MRLQIILLLLFLGVPAFSGAQVIDCKLFGAYDTAMGDREPLLRSRDRSAPGYRRVEPQFDPP